MFRLASCIVCSKTYLSTSKLHRVLCHPGRKQLILLCSCGFGFKIGDGRTSFLATPHRNHCGTLPSPTSPQIKSIVDYVYRNDDGRGVVVDIDGLSTTRNSSILSRVSAEKAEVHKTCEKAPPKLKKCFPSCKSDSFSTTNLSIPSHAVPEEAQVLKGCNKTLLKQKKYFGFKIGDGRTSFLATPHRNHCGTLPSPTSPQIKSIVDYVYRNDDGRGVVVDIDGLSTTRNSSILSRVSAEKAEVHKTCEKAPPKLKKCFPSCKSDSFSTTNLSIPSHAVPEEAQVLKGCNKTLLLEQKKYFPCAICARNFNRRANLLRHYTLKHSNKEEEIV